MNPIWALNIVLPREVQTMRLNFKIMANNDEKKTFAMA